MFAIIGGTLGLLCGFSIISGVEIIYFAVKIVIGSFKKSSSTKDRQNKKKRQKITPKFSFKRV